MASSRRRTDSRSARAPRRALAGLLVAAAVSAVARSGADGQALPAGTSGTPFERAIRAAFADAAARLADDPCLRVLAEFRDRAGVALSAKLEQTGSSAPDYVRGLAAADGDHRELCQPGNVLAGTRPGSRLVFFCARRFSRIQFLDPELAAAVVIHEALHSLGLSENPPSSQEITDRVLARCRR